MTVKDSTTFYFKTHTFVCHQKRDVIFDDIPDPEILKQLSIRARDDLFEKQGNKYVLRLADRIFSCSKCGQDYNPVAVTSVDLSFKTNYCKIRCKQEKELVS